MNHDPMIRVKKCLNTLKGRFFYSLLAFAFHCLGVTQNLADIQWDIQSPLDYQVFQRESLESGRITIKGKIEGLDAAASILQFRLGDHPNKDWIDAGETLKNGSIDCNVEVPAGDWHQVELRIINGGVSMGEHIIPHVGVGELFIVAGQSNSANHGEERQRVLSGKVSAFDGIHWRIADDPQPGASGKGGSFIPVFGDAMARYFQVPIGVVACGIGATSVREWLPAGSRFPNPPTLTGRVELLANGEWTSKGEAYDMFTGRMRSLQAQRFRAVLWHQGESDANQRDPARTLSGKLYRESLEKLILSSRKAISRDVPWFVALVSYHIPGDESSVEIREAQASLWRDGIVLKGPDSDAIKGHFRERNGQGVHFSAEGLKEHGLRWFDAVAPWLESVLSQ